MKLSVRHAVVTSSWLAAAAALGCAPGASAGRRVTLVAAPGSPLPVRADCVAVADCNADRRPDLIVTVGTRLQTHFGDGTGRFRAAPDRQLDMAGPASEIAVADVDGDGRADVATAHHDRYAVAVFLGNADGGFRPAPGSPFWPKRGDHPHTHGLLLADLNEDGNPDLVTANNADGDVAVMIGDGRGGFASPARAVFDCGPSPYPVAAADVDGDGHVDLLVPNSAPAVRTVTVLLGDGTGAFAPAPTSPAHSTGDTYFVATGDLNGDGRPDAVVCGNDDDRATVLLNDGRGKLTPASVLRMGNRGWHMRVVDFDRDGTADLLAVTEDSVRVFSGDGRGGFRPTPMVVTPSGGKGCWKLAVGDLNDDGTLDVATPNVESHDLAILLSQQR